MSPGARPRNILGPRVLTLGQAAASTPQTRFVQEGPMKFLRCGLALVVAAVVLFPLPTAARSDMSGIHAIVERVVFEPATGTPARIQVWGAFRIGKAAPGGGAGTPELGRGYLYFSVPPVPFSCTGCPPASAATQTALYQWNDLKAVAGYGRGRWIRPSDVCGRAPTGDGRAGGSGCLSARHRAVQAGYGPSVPRRPEEAVALTSPAGRSLDRW